MDLSASSYSMSRTVEEESSSGEMGIYLVVLRFF